MQTLSIIQDLLKLLPHYSEEGNRFSVVNKGDIKKQLLEKTEFPEDVIQTVLDLSERLMFSICVLDEFELINGNWKFVSFLAQLMTNSLLNTLSDPKQKLLPNHFWETDSGDVEAQRKILDFIETHREQYHQEKSAIPIRFIYVAWALIKLDSKFLFYHREDKTREKQGNYVPIGGRFNPTDLVAECKMLPFHNTFDDYAATGI